MSDSLRALQDKAGVHKTFSKINLQPQEAVAKIKRASNQTTNTLALRQAYEQTVSMHKSAKRLIEHPRLFAHVAVVGAVAAVVLGGGLVSASSRSQAMSQLGSANGLVATLDPAMSAELAAKVAVATALPVNAEVNGKSSNVAALMADDNALAPQEVIATAQSLRRTVTTYKVAEGDTIDTVAKKFNITTDTIRWANDIKADGGVAVGQDLKILPVNGLLYTVLAGDTPDTLAARFRTTASAISEFNDADVKGLPVGATVIIPSGQPVAPAPTVASRTTIATASNSYYGGRLQGNGNSYSWGQCTWYVANRRAVPNNWGNAYTWLARARAAGWATGSEPRAGAIGWERGNHVVYVESVNANGTVNISEMNWGGRVGVVHYRTEPASRFLYIY